MEQMAEMNSGDQRPEQAALQSAGAIQKQNFPVGVVLPTYNRAPVLLRCLRYLERQSWMDFEVVVVDDGSTDDTCARVEAFAKQTSLALRYLCQSNSGPARARNRAIAELRSPVCIMIGDDTFPQPAFVEKHLALHRRCPEPTVVGLGYTCWSEQEQTVTSFMRWLDRDGMQFAYGDLRRGVPPTWKHFYTSNLSLKTGQLRRFPFDESFRKAAMEDIELGYRMHARGGIKVCFLPDAIAEHLHPTDVSQACRRMVTVGAAAYRLGQLWPELRPATGGSAAKIRARSFLLRRRWLFPLLQWAATVTTRFRCPNVVLLKALALHSSLGYQQAAQAKSAG